MLLNFADAQFGGGRAYNVPQSPCPQTFQYRSNGFEVIGVGQILPGQYVIGETIQMMAYMIISTSLPSVSTDGEVPYYPEDHQLDTFSPLAELLRQN